MHREKDPDASHPHPYPVVSLGIDSTSCGRTNKHKRALTPAPSNGAALQAHTQAASALLPPGLYAHTQQGAQQCGFGPRPGPAFVPRLRRPQRGRTPRTAELALPSWLTGNARALQFSCRFLLMGFFLDFFLALRGECFVLPLPLFGLTL